MRFLLVLSIVFASACSDSSSDASRDEAAFSNSSDSVEVATEIPATGDAAEARANAAIAQAIESEPDFAFVGDWMCEGDDAAFGYVSFGYVNDNVGGVFETFIDNESAESGSWTLSGSTLALAGSDGTMTFSAASVDGTTMSLTDIKGTTFTCDNVPMSP